MKKSLKCIAMLAIVAIVFVSCKSTTSPTPSNAQSIKVLAPNGNEIYSPGDSVYFVWKTNNLPDTVDTQVSIMDERTIGFQTCCYFGVDNPLKYAKIISRNGNEKTYRYAFVVPENFNESLPLQYKNIFGGKHYKMTVIALCTGAVGADAKTIEDSSDSNFEIK